MLAMARGVRPRRRSARSHHGPTTHERLSDRGTIRRLLGTLSRQESPFDPPRLYRTASDIPFLGIESDPTGGPEQAVGRPSFGDRQADADLGSKVRGATIASQTLPPKS
eukprot:7768558-Alexandrium_andersonii.AAC.1